MRNPHPSLRLACLATLLLVGALGASAAPAAAAGCPNAEFRIGASAGLPDCRAYEMVSPPGKNGGDIMLDSSRIRAARAVAPGQEMAIQFPSRSGFGDVRGTGVGAEYLSRRDGVAGTRGWATHALTPLEDPMRLLDLTGLMESRFLGEFSDDLSTGLFLSYSPLTDSPNVAGVENLYVRDDIRTAGEGSHHLISDCPGCSSPLVFGFLQTPFQVPRPAGASEDFSHVIFASPYRLTADAPPCSQPPFNVAACATKLYEWEDGTVRLAGVLPDSACGSPPCAAPSSFAGAGSQSRSSAWEITPQHAISNDGRRIFFTFPTNASGSAVSLNGTAGKLYMRLDHAETVQLNASERDPALPESSFAIAKYQEAAADGSRVFFTTAQALTDDASVNGEAKLYMYDTTKPDSDPHNLTLLSVDSADDGFDAAVVGVVGASADGRSVYFTTTTQLVDGEPVFAPLEATGLFLWHDGDLRYVGSLDYDPGTLDTNRDNLLPNVRRMARVTPDGSHVLFASRRGENLTGYGHGVACNGLSSSNEPGCREFYVYDADADELQCASCNPSGAPPSDDARNILGNLQTDRPSFTGLHSSRALTDDGRLAFFSTTERLVPEDVNGVSDAYEFDTTTGQVHLLSSGTDPANSYFADASADGDDVFIVTRERLVGWDVDDNSDLYSVRVNGGFPEPPPAGQPCADSDACQGVAGGGSDADVSGSSAVRKDGNADAGDRLRLTVVTPSRAARARAARRGVLVLKVRASRAALVTATARARMRGRVAVVGSGRGRARRSGVATVRIRLNRTATRALRSRRSLGLSLSVRATGARPRAIAVLLPGDDR